MPDWEDDPDNAAWSIWRSACPSQRGRPPRRLLVAIADGLRFAKAAGKIEGRAEMKAEARSAVLGAAGSWKQCKRCADAIDELE